MIVLGIAIGITFTILAIVVGRAMIIINREQQKNEEDK